MKKLISILLLLCSISLFAQNRVATLADITKYGTYINVGDWILDRPTNPVPLADGANQIRYTKVSTTFPGIREGANIWIDGDKIGPLSEIRLLNGTESTPWHISTATVRPIPNTRVNGIYTANSYGGFLYLIQGLKNLTMDGGTSDKYPGLSSFPASRVFMQGSFGIGATSNGIYTGYHEYSLSVLDGGSITMRNCEGEGGFSSIRLQGGSVDQKITVLIELCYVHDTVSEGAYIGFTHAPPGAKIKDLIIRNCLFVRTGSEAIQMQHLIGNAHVYNITLHNADVSWQSQFMPGQDTGIQLNADEGNNLIENIALDSWGSNGCNLFGSNAYPAGTNSLTTLRNVLFNDGRGPAIYLHNSCKYGMKWKLSGLIFRKPNYDYFKTNKSPEPGYFVSAHNGTDSIWFDDITFSAKVNGVLPKLFQNPSKLIIGTSKVDETLPEIEYVNPGFYEPASKIKTWFPILIGYISGNNTTPTHWDAGDIAIDVMQGSRPIFCKALVTHEATLTRPRDNPEQFEILLWDEKGVRSDRPDYNPRSVQRTYPPDDFRVKYQSYYGKKGIGFVENAPDYFELLQHANTTIQKQDSTINGYKGLINGLSTTLEKYK